MKWTEQPNGDWQSEEMCLPDGSDQHDILVTAGVFAAEWYSDLPPLEHTERYMREKGYVTVEELAA